MITLLLLVILVSSVAFLFNGGLWDCAIAFFNIIFAALLATNYFEPLASFFDRQYHGLTFAWDFTAIWLIFVVAYGLLRFVTDFLSKVKVRFKRPIDLAGGILFATLSGWIMVCFTAMTLHASPLTADFAFSNPQEPVFFGFSPDRVWLAFAQQTSQGALGRSNTFDPQGDYIFKYRERRVKYAAIGGMFAGKTD